LIVSLQYDQAETNFSAIYARKKSPAKSESTQEATEGLTILGVAGLTKGWLSARDDNESQKPYYWESDPPSEAPPTYDPPSHAHALEAPAAFHRIIIATTRRTIVVATYEQSWDRAQVLETTLLELIDSMIGQEY